jgi:Tol biopolymer transport system component
MGCRSSTDSSAVALPIVFFEGCCLTGQLDLMSEDGALERKLIDLPQGFAQYPRWSPDGRKIVFYRNSANPQGSGGLFIINADGSGLRELSPPNGGLVGADWSPDGTRLVVYTGVRLAVIGEDGTGLSLLPVTNAESRFGTWGLSWSPNGNEILYNGSHDVGGNPAGPDVWVFNLITGQSRMLATPGLDARWSPDGNHVAYIATDQGDPGSLTVMNGDGSNPRILVPKGSAGNNRPDFAWSPDGKRLLYAGERAPCGCTDLYTISIDGGESTNITKNLAGKFSRRPDWLWTR